MAQRPILTMPGEKVALLPVKLIRDYWRDAGEQLLTGDEIDLPAEEARRLVRDGIAERNDAF